MTVIAGFNYALFGILLADSRLSGSQGRHLLTRDVGQKIFPLGEAGLLTWSGGLYTARGVMHSLVERHRRDGPWWLLDASETEGTLMGNYKRCEPKYNGPQVSFVVQLINPWASAFKGEDWPRIDMAVIDIDPFRHEVVHMGARVRGAGQYIVPRMEEDQLFGEAFGFSSAWPDLERAVIRKALFAQSALDNLVRERSEPTIGGLYQIGYMLSDRVRVLSYERWVGVGDDSGTYVRLVVEDGHWFQEHPPTGRRVRLQNPFVESVELQFHNDLVFDVAKLPPGAPGVEPTGQSQRLARFLSAHGVGGAPRLFDPKPYRDAAAAR